MIYSTAAAAAAAVVVPLVRFVFLIFFFFFWEFSFSGSGYLRWPFLMYLCIFNSDGQPLVDKIELCSSYFSRTKILTLIWIDFQKRDKTKKVEVPLRIYLNQSPVLVSKLKISNIN